MQPTLLGEFLKAHLPTLFFEASFLKIALWQWSSLTVILILAYFLSWYLSKAFLHMVFRLLLKQFPMFEEAMVKTLFAPLHILFLLAFLSIGTQTIGLNTSVHSIFVLFQKFVLIFNLTWLSFRTVDIFTERLIELLIKENKISIITMLPLISRIFKVSVTVLAALTTLQNLGFEVTALIAGLGIGGIAIALAAQKTLENLFGGAMLILDQPIRVGNFCRFGVYQGTVEEIGLRSTKIRTLERTLISVPNSDLSQMELENFDMRDRFRFYNIVSLDAQTSPDQIRYLLATIRQLLLNHPRVDNDSARVRFIGFGAYALEIEIHAYILTSIQNEFMETRENLLLCIMDIITQSRTSLAFPIQTVYVHKSS
jgi:MscS family membrane protein